MKRISLRSAFVTTALLVFAACSSTKHTTGNSSATAMNSKCPVSGEELQSGSPTSTFDGQTVAFCCDKCKAKFDGMSPSEKKAKVTGAMPTK